ncbi:hypothetical protein WR25_07973 [Diploscapter pachys]|uniref:Low molecular weight phosphotyrosine protein phosphatase n=1 Tax=Diploscapter pachys TaxID=2018661 RepID=A0A2A2KP09_9BILA|nr:hypothetical protein WR25_07973 [Diploscapter pachys]
MSDDEQSALFVCLGNICRSPMAEAIFGDTLEKRGIRDKWHVDSAAVVGYHTGKNPYSKTMSTLAKNGITNYSHKARVVSSGDFKKFDHIFGMDADNMRDLKRLASAESKAKLYCLADFDPKKEIYQIVDPYYDSTGQLFDQIFPEITRCLEAFLDSLEK